jgi:hypothetical protein
MCLREITPYKYIETLKVVVDTAIGHYSNYSAGRQKHFRISLKIMLLLRSGSNKISSYASSRSVFVMYAKFL